MKGIEWIKLNTNMCEDETMRLIDSLPLRDCTNYVWIRLLLQAGKVNDGGLIYLKKDVPYTKKMLSILFNRPLDIIEKVLDILESFKLIKIYENGVIKICNWEKHQNIEGMKRVKEGTRERVKNFRERKKKEKELVEKKLNTDEACNNAINEGSDTNKINKNKNCNANVTLQKEKREEDKGHKKKNIDKKENKEKDKVNDVALTKENDESYDKAHIQTKILSSSHDEIKSQALKIIKTLEEDNKVIRGFTLSWVIKELMIHKEKYVEMAVREAIERNKLDINYINGILKNWLKEGYPKDYEDMEFNDCDAGNSSFVKEKPKLRFINFEPRQYDYDDLEKKLLGWNEDS